MNSLNTNLNIVRALLIRDMYVIRQNLARLWINSAVAFFIDIILFGSFIPLMGLPAAMVGPIFLGSVIGRCFFKITTKAFESIRDIHFTKFIEYHLTLPLPKSWLFAQMILSRMIEVLIDIIPFIIVGIIALHTFFDITPFGFIKGILFFVLVTIFLNIAALACSYYYEYSWFMSNIWPRRFGLVYAFAPIYFSWQQAYIFSPRVAQALLANPLTYCTEGFRATMLESDTYISLPICSVMLLAFVCFAVVILRTGIKKRLDPV